jgi:hypothetical protein
MDVGSVPVQPHPPEHVPYELIASEGSVRDVPAVGQRPEHLPRNQLVLAPRPNHYAEDPVRILEGREEPELDVGCPGGVLRQLPGCAHRHGAGESIPRRSVTG